MLRSIFIGIFIFLPSIFFVCVSYSQSNPTISILTCDRGDALYSTFGHTGIRIKDTVRNQDYVFNYGTFNSFQDNFYIKFLRGKLMYRLATSSYDTFIAEYDFFKRGVKEQILDLNKEETVEIVSFLRENFKLENRNYKYDFFFDNCSTRVGDILLDQLGWKYNRPASGKTFRDLLDENLVALPWSDFGIDLVIGAKADKKAAARQETFLPEYLYRHFAETSKGGRSLVRSESQLLSFPDEEAQRDHRSWFNAVSLFFVLLILEIFIVFRHRKSQSKWIAVYDFVRIFLAALISMIIMFLWFGTDHIATKSNWNLLWLSPLFIVLAVLFKKRKTSSIFKWSALITMCLIGISLLGWFVIPQSFHTSFVFIMLILMSVLFRCWMKGHRDVV